MPGSRTVIPPSDPGNSNKGERRTVASGTWESGRNGVHSEINCIQLIPAQEYVLSLE